MLMLLMMSIAIAVRSRKRVAAVSISRAIALHLFLLQEAHPRYDTFVRSGYSKLFSSMRGFVPCCC